VHEAHCIDLAELLTWWERCAEYARDFWMAGLYARNNMLRRFPSHRQQILELAALLDQVRRPLMLHAVRLRPTDSIDAFCETQNHCRTLGVWTTAALAVYDDDMEALKNFARIALCDGEKWPALSVALVENRLHGWTDWRQARDPQAWIAARARAIADDEGADGDAPDTEAKAGDALGPRRATVPLEEIAGTPAESSDHGITVQLVYSFELKDEARRRGDLELVAYIEGLEAARAQGLDKRDAHRQVRKLMGWDKFAASKVRGRFERLKNEAAEYVAHGIVSDASLNVFKEPLFGGSQGREHFDWRHKPLPPHKPLKTKEL